jgi:hypothetical protein
MRRSRCDDVNFPSDHQGLGTRPELSGRDDATISRVSGRSGIPISGNARIFTYPETSDVIPMSTSDVTNSFKDKELVKSRLRSGPKAVASRARHRLVRRAYGAGSR